MATSTSHYYHRKFQGSRVAQQLSGSWRRSVSACVGSEAEWNEVAGLLIGTGAGGLAWWRLRHSELQACHMTQQFKHVYFRILCALGCQCKAGHSIT